ncbi:hypothetical protein K470DRAFT_282436 [Piedraia hortae CBS 480.64]|uniref:UDENN domain-containing protein n=1 Tax=Piedraia hortae CBS 480.64 TaxID=1314780 RepID=A0A6A7BX39_9PEZI|nr:hypothetical protein K470DRAFT_282436 [Piedraia hortae CBS 480.64]
MSRFKPQVCVVDFHHSRGPEIETWLSHDGGNDSDDEHGRHIPPAFRDAQWTNIIPYMALPDGAHQNVEEFSYFTLAMPDPERPRTVFGISCCRQIDVQHLSWKADHVTRSAVQKAVVCLTDRPQDLTSNLRESLRVVTRTWFAQGDFRDVDVLERFWKSLVLAYESKPSVEDLAEGCDLRELVKSLRANMLIAVKAMLLQRRTLFFSTSSERVCQAQFSFLSLLPGLGQCLADCASPEMDFYAENARPADSVRSSDRGSLLAYMGLPLQIFGKGAMFAPYAPLQILDSLAETPKEDQLPNPIRLTSYIIGSTSSIILSQKERYCDILIDLDARSISILKPTLRAALSLSSPDRRWIESLTSQVENTTIEHGYVGNDDFIRASFEEYILALVSAERYHLHLASQGENVAEISGDPSIEFNPNYLDGWRETRNHALWDRLTKGAGLFDIIEPRHPGGLGWWNGLAANLAGRSSALATRGQAGLSAGYEQMPSREVVGQKIVGGFTSVLNKVWTAPAAAEAAVRGEEKEKGMEKEEGDKDDGDEEDTFHDAKEGSVHTVGDDKERSEADANDKTKAGLEKGAEKPAAQSWSAWAAEKRAAWKRPE